MKRLQKQLLYSFKFASFVVLLRIFTQAQQLLKPPLLSSCLSHTVGEEDKNWHKILILSIVAKVWVGFSVKKS